MEANVTHCETELVVIYSYEEGEDQTWDSFGSAPKVEVEAVFAKDSEVDLFHILKLNVIEDLENIIIELKRI